jgi:predicted alpha/beta superfamily hydrolase
MSLRTVAFFILALVFSALSAVAKAAADSPPGYVIPDTEVRDIHSTALGRDYQVYVALPLSYASQPEKKYPVLFVTDATYAFPLIRAISRRVGDHGKGLEDFILVGLSYAGGDTPEYSRRRDYTPSTHGDADSVSDMPGRKPAYGEADAYAHFIEAEVFPLISANYRADMQRKIFAGHSFGGLLGAQILLSKPAMFEQYILSSPSLWFDSKLLFQRERSYAQTHKDLPAKVFFFVGSYEAVDPAHKNPRYNISRDMVKDTLAFEQALKSHHYPSLKTQSKVLDDEDHLSVMPPGITRGLQWALPVKKNH